MEYRIAEGSVQRTDRDATAFAFTAAGKLFRVMVADAAVAEHLRQQSLPDEAYGQFIRRYASALCEAAYRKRMEFVGAGAIWLMRGDLDRNL